MKGSKLMIPKNISAKLVSLIFIVISLSGCMGNRNELRDCSTCPELVVVPAGEFDMGSPPNELNRDKDEGPVRKVSISNPFAIGKYEITRGEFAQFIDATNHKMSKNCLVWNGSALAATQGKSWLDPGYPVSDRHPMVCVSWHDASAYADWLTKKTGHRYRLPSEAEWEYATRGGVSSAYAFPGEVTAACTYGNVSDKSAKASVPNWNALDCDDGVGFGTARVGSYLPNNFGLHDTVGNVWEWVADCYHESYDEAPFDGTAWGTAGGCGRGLDRGGGFSNIFPGHLRAANRSQAPTPNAAVYSLGFRLVRELTEQEFASLKK